ncbi:ras guanyl-releasing protein 3 isoform X2 [Anabrus simplex]|uniref:ras guanyl-releasing protein 3 isoform X2 n=1 Tax=Anabrus simplex TaxID=316456 RepID=UPI0035A27B48
MVRSRCEVYVHRVVRRVKGKFDSKLVAATGDDRPAREMAGCGAADIASTGVLVEDEPVVPGLPIRAATLPALARLLVHAFDKEGEPHGDYCGLPGVLFLMHHWFTTSMALAEQLVALHRQAEDEQLRRKVCHAFRFWILQYPIHFNLERGLASSLRQFQDTLLPSEAELVDLSQVPSYDWMRNMSVRSGTTTGVRKVSLVFNHLQPLQLAEHLTFLEHKVLRRIPFQEVKQYVQTGSLSQTPKLERSVALCNGLTQWVQCMVLSRTTPTQRAQVMAKFIAVAQKLLELQNFNSLMAVVGSVSHSVLARLSRTMNCLPPECKRALNELMELLSSSGNFSNYRKALTSCQGFKIPILGIHLKDLVSLHVALPDRLEGDMLNIRKMAQLSLLFQELEQLQRTGPPFDVNMDLVNTLRLSLDLAYTEDEIYELSLAREPRNATSPQSSPTQSVLFAEWAAGPTTPPDPQTIEKHVVAMVEAVFKNYDNDRDGYISQEEFEAVAGNFPFIASFCVLDADHDGMISQEEMKKYFIHANCHALKSGFKHEFHETTYFKPTFCSHCAGLLWGLIRQGYKCKDCGINAHKHCKDLVVMECRLRTGPPPGDSNTHSANSRRRFRRKKKSSESESSPPSPKYSTTGDSEHSDGGGGGGSLPPSPKPSALWPGPRRKISDSLLVPSQSRNSARLRPQQSCPETRHRPPLAHQAAIQQTNYVDFNLNHQKLIALQAKVIQSPPEHQTSTKQGVQSQQVSPLHQTNVKRPSPLHELDVDDRLLPGAHQNLQPSPICSSPLPEHSLSGTRHENLPCESHKKQQALASSCKQLEELHQKLQAAEEVVPAL